MFENKTKKSFKEQGINDNNIYHVALEYRVQKEELENDNKHLRLALLKKNDELVNVGEQRIINILKECVYEDPMHNELFIHIPSLISHSPQGHQLYRELTKDK